MKGTDRKTGLGCLALIVLVYCVCKGHTQQNDQHFIVLSNQTEYTVLVGGNISLVCGSHSTHKSSLALHVPSIIWYLPNGTSIKIDPIVWDGAGVVRLNITNASAVDGGIWNCTVTGTANDSIQLSTVALEIQLTVVSPPGQPYNLTIIADKSASHSWVSIWWQAPSNRGSHGISYYNVTLFSVTLPANMEELISELNTVGNETRINITNLRPGLLMRIKVAGVSQVGNLIAQGPISESIQFNTSDSVINTSTQAPLDDEHFIDLSNQTEYTVLVGGNVSLVCGSHLTHKSSLALHVPSIIWYSPNGTRTKIDPEDVTTVVDGAGVVRLNITNASAVDDGIWNCTVTVTATDSIQLSTVALEIQLTVVSPPGQPYNLTIVADESASHSWVSIWWQAPNDCGSHGISYYTVTVFNVTPIANMEELISKLRTEGNETRINITELQPGLLMRIKVAGVSQVGNLTAQGPSISESIQFSTSDSVINTSTQAPLAPMHITPMPVCNNKPHLLTSNMYTTNIMFIVVWSYQHTEGLPLSRVVVNYSISARTLSQVDAFSRISGSEDLQMNQTSRKLSFSSVNVQSGVVEINVTVTVNSSQDSHTDSCPPLYLDVTVIQLVLNGIHDCSFWVLHDSIEKREAIMELLYGSIQNTCLGCEYTMTNQAMECAEENNNVVKLRAKLISPSSMTEHILNLITSWIIHTQSIEVRGLRLHLEESNNCPLIIESLESPLYCYQTTSSVSTGPPPQERPTTVAEFKALAIIAVVGCGILVMIVLLLILYIAYKHYYQKAINHSSNLEAQENELQIPMVNEGRLLTTSRVSIPETIPECEFEESEKDGHEDFEFSTSLAYGAVDTVTASRLRLGSDLGSITEDIERTYNNPIYEGNPVYETIKLESSKRPNSLVENESLI